MSNISANTLFHFTKKDFLLKILEEGFQPRYCLESITFSTKVNNIAFPMVCFCDIPLSLINNHIAYYGNYGLGLTLEWAKNNKLNPILYLNPDSHLSTNILTLMNNVSGKPANDAMINVMRYFKNFEGVDPRVGGTNTKKFYDEKEWRYIPEENTFMEFLHEDDYNDETIRNLHNSILANYKLIFSPSDIKYIIIKEDKEIASVINNLKKINKYTSSEIELLTTKILTCEQIKNDI